jgi:hypothetical protein
LDCYEKFKAWRFSVNPLKDEVNTMFSHEGTAIEVLLFIFGFAGFALALWFSHAYFERKTKNGVKKQHSGR